MQLLSGELWGYLSSLCFIVCGIPQAWQCLKSGTSKGLNSPFLWLWTFGEIFLIFYAYYLSSIPMYLNAFFNLLCLGIIFKYLYYPRKEKN